VTLRCLAGRLTFKRRRIIGRAAGRRTAVAVRGGVTAKDAVSPKTKPIILTFFNFITVVPPCLGASRLSFRRWPVKS